MASNISNMMNSKLRFSGMVSGLDTESMIKQLMKVETAKVDKVKQQRTLLEWKRDSYRSVTNLLRGFNSEYFDVLKPSTYFRSSTAFGVYKSTVQVNGKDSSKVTVNATAAAKPGTHTLEIISLAQKSIWESSGTVTGAMQGGDIVSANLRKGKEFAVTLDGVRKTITLEKDYITDSSTLEADLNTLLKNAFGANNITVGRAGDKLTFTSVGHALQISDTPSTYANSLGFGSGQSNSCIGSKITFPSTVKGDIKIVVDGTVNAVSLDVTAANMDELVSGLNTQLSGKGITVAKEGEDKLKFISNDPQKNVQFLNNGSVNVLGSLGFASGTQIKSLQGAINLSVLDQGKDFDIYVTGHSDPFHIDITKDYTAINLSDLETEINGQLTGSGIKAVITGGVLKFELDGAAAGTEIKIANSTESTTQNMGFPSGSMNTMNMGMTLKELYAKQKGDPLFELPSVTDEAGNTFKGVQFQINGKTLTFKETDTLGSVISKINSSGAGVTLSYSSVNDKFTLQANTEGAANNIEDTDLVDMAGTDLLKGVFKLAKAKDADGNDIDGKDAEIILDGVTTTRGTNKFTVDGVEYNLAATTGAGEVINIGISANPDDMVEKVKKFVEKYNEMIDKLTTLTSEKRPRTGSNNTGDYYLPLTDEQKEAMSEDDIKRWEEKAKTGLLNGDSILKNISDQMRRAMYDSISGVTGGLYSIGIKTGTYDQKGKLTIDEEKLKNALVNDPETVMNVFVKESETSYSPDLSSADRAKRYSENGIANRMYDIIQDSIRTTRNSAGKKGVLLEKAGIEGDITEFKNLLYNDMKDKDSTIYKLTQKLIDKENYYYKKFAAMEQALSRMNSQSSWLSSQLGGGGQ